MDTMQLRNACSVRDCIFQCERLRVHAAVCSFRPAQPLQIINILRYSSYNIGLQSYLHCFALGKIWAYSWLVVDGPALTSRHQLSEALEHQPVVGSGCLWWALVVCMLMYGSTQAASTVVLPVLAWACILLQVYGCRYAASVS